MARAGAKPPRLLLQGALQRPPIGRERQPHAAPVGVVGNGREQTPVTQALDRAGELRLVAPAVLRQVLLRGAGVAAEVAQHLAIHVRDLVRPVAREAVLLRPPCAACAPRTEAARPESRACRSQPGRPRQFLPGFEYAARRGAADERLRPAA